MVLQDSDPTGAEITFARGGNHGIGRRAEQNDGSHVTRQSELGGEARGGGFRRTLRSLPADRLERYAFSVEVGGGSSYA